ncbi:MAG TPA: LPXTG cell wall anchor domain-containing protein [Solirubrobacterales bacterium]
MRLGAYTFVIWRRPDGVLIADRSLNVRAEQSPTSSQGTGTDTAWWIAAAVAIVAVAGAAAFLRRRRTP